MDTSKRRKRRNEDTVPCECGCGTPIYKYGPDNRVRRFASGHQFRGNKFGAKPYHLSAILEQVEPLRPFCACGCGEKLEIPEFLQQKGRGIISIQSSWTRHPYKKGHGLLEKRTSNYINKLGVIDPEELGLIYGTLLGDGSISYPNKNSRFPRLCWTHGVKQREWMEYKASRLSGLRPKLRIAKNMGFGDTSVCCNTCCHPQLRDVFSIVKPTKEKKLVFLDWLSQVTIEGLAWWYMDDGTLIKSRNSFAVHLCTEGYSKEENQIIARWLTSIGYLAKTKSYKKPEREYPYYFISMDVSTSKKWLSALSQ